MNFGLSEKKSWTKEFWFDGLGTRNQPSNSLYLTSTFMMDMPADIYLIIMVT